MSPSVRRLSAVQREMERAGLRIRNGVRFVTASDVQAPVTPSTVVWQFRGASVRKYAASPPAQNDPAAVFVIHGLVGRAEIWDLLPGGSVIEHLTSAGITVYLLDFGTPTNREASNTLETYCDRLIPSAFAAARKDWTAPHLFAMGYCFGGVLALLWAAAQAAREHAPVVAGLVFVATPVDFSQIGSLVESIRPDRVDVHKLLDETGNVPPEVIRNSMRMLRPTDDVVNYVNLMQRLWDDAYVASYQTIANWAKDAMPFPGQTFVQCIDLLVRKNLLLSGAIPLGGRVVRLADITVPSLVMIAGRDHIVPKSAAQPLLSLLGGTSDLVEVDAGHVALLMGGRAQKQTVPALTAWMSQVSSHGDRQTKGPA